MTEYEIEATGQRVVKNKYEFFTYKEDWDKAKEDLGLTDEELREKVESCLQVWAWADILRDVRDMVEHEDGKMEPTGDGTWRIT